LFLPLQSIPYLRLAKRIFSGRGSLEAIAYEKETLCNVESEIIAPAVFLAGQLDKITEFPNDPWFGQVSVPGQIADVTSIFVSHPPTIAYHIKDAVLFDGSIYVGKYRYPLHAKTDNSMFKATEHVTEHFEKGALASTYLGSRFFFHWLADDCTRYLLAEDAARVICARRMYYPHQNEYDRYFRQDWNPTDRARIDNLIVYEDFSQNSNKRKRYDILRERIRPHIQPVGTGGGVYLRRGNTGAARLVQNEDEIVASLIKRGFVVIDVGRDTLGHLIGTLFNAKIVVSTEGSHISHCIYASPKDSSLLVLQPCDRFSSIHRSWSASLGLGFGFVVGDRSDQGYYFPVSDILRTIDLLLG
jgi:hypothetical protein